MTYLFSLRESTSLISFEIAQRLYIQTKKFKVGFRSVLEKYQLKLCDVFFYNILDIFFSGQTEKLTAC